MVQRTDWSVPSSWNALPTPPPREPHIAFRRSSKGPSRLSDPLRTLVRIEVIDPAEIMKGFRRVDLRAARANELRGALDDIRCVRARLDRVEAVVARRLETVTGTPERDVAKGAQRSNRHGAKVVARAAALANTPELSDALEAGVLGGDHVDVFAKVLGALDGPVKSRLTEAAPTLIEQAAASGSTPEEFAVSLNAAAEQITADGGTSQVKILLNQNENQATIRGEFNNLSSAQTTARIEIIAGTTSVVYDFGTIGGANGNFATATIAVTPMQVQQLRTGLWSAVIGTQNNPTGEIRGSLRNDSDDNDFDGDGSDDFAVFRPSTGTWYTQNSEGFSGRVFGSADDKVVSGDYDGDGKTDAAVFRNQNGLGVWYLVKSPA